MILSDIQRKERQNKVNEDENVQTVEHVVDGLNLKRREISDVSLYVFINHEFHESCHSVTLYSMKKKDSKRFCDTTIRDGSRKFRWGGLTRYRQWNVVFAYTN